MVVGIRHIPPTGGPVVTEAIAWIGEDYREVELGGPSLAELAWAINDEGRAVGYDGGRPARWTVGTDTAEELPSPNGAFGEALAINNRGMVVGASQPSGAALYATVFTRK